MLFSACDSGLMSALIQQWRPDILIIQRYICYVTRKSSEMSESSFQQNRFLWTAECPYAICAQTIFVCMAALPQSIYFNNHLSSIYGSTSIQTRPLPDSQGRQMDQHIQQKASASENPTNLSSLLVYTLIPQFSSGTSNFTQRAVNLSALGGLVDEESKSEKSSQVNMSMFSTNSMQRSAQR